MNEDKPKLNKGPWWAPAMRIFSEISTWIFVPIILALVGGKALDEHFGTKPYLFLACVGLSFLVSAYGIVKAVKNFTKRLNK